MLKITEPINGERRMLKRATLSLIAVTLVITGSARAFDSGPVRRAVEKGGNWLVAQYNAKTNSFGATAAAPEQLAMAIKALCDNPRDYKEANGPYISEPVKTILSKIDDKGHVSGSAANEAEAALWIITALKSTKNEAYKPIIEKLRERVKELGKTEHPKFEAAHLQPTVANPESMRNAIAAVLKAGEEGTKEITVDGKPVKWAEVLGESLARLQQPDGSFAADLQTNAMALYALNLCVKNL